MIAHARISLSFVAVVLLILVGASALPASWKMTADSVFAAAEDAFARGDYRSSADLYARVVRTIEENEGEELGAYFARRAAVARYLMARSHEHIGHWDVAAEAYERALTELDEVADVVRIRLARCRTELRDLDAAVELLRKVIDDGERSTFDRAAVEQLADCYHEAGSYDMAVQWYRVLQAKLDSYDDRARAHYKIGLAYEKRGDRDAAKRSYATAVNEFPRSSHAHDALKRARHLSKAFTDRYHQGLVLYNRRHYTEAAEFFQYYLRHNDGREFELEATYFQGRSHQRRGRFRTAARSYEDAIALGGDSEYVDLAWEKLAYCRRAVGDIDESLATYDRYARDFPDRPGVAGMLYAKGRLLEEEKRWADAEVAYADVTSRFPEPELSGDARFRGGLCLFKLGLYDEADAAFAEIYIHSDGESAARALFWAGKSREELQEPEAAAQRYAEAFEAATDSYYGQRALARLEVLSGDALGGPATASERGSDSHGFAAWLARWYDRIYFPADRIALRQRLWREPAFVRASTLLALHMGREAAAEFTELEDAVGGDPRVSDVLSDYYISVGLNRRAIRVAERILAMSPAGGLSEAPLHLRKKICPVHHRDLIETACGERGLDPNVFFSLIRQESLFEHDAISWVGARGLTQIMPATGRWIARRTGTRGFETADLIDPETNVGFGAYYLSLQIEDFDGDLMRALAAYNGGPDNVDRWWGYGGGRDTDVFVEDIGYAETRDYVRRVYLYSRYYESAYGRRTR